MAWSESNGNRLQMQILSGSNWRNWLIFSHNWNIFGQSNVLNKLHSLECDEKVFRNEIIHVRFINRNRFNQWIKESPIINNRKWSGKENWFGFKWKNALDWIGLWFDPNSNAHEERFSKCLIFNHVKCPSGFEQEWTQTGTVQETHFTERANSP
jgi:hypothetical protein